jgi:hypothetical protein
MYVDTYWAETGKVSFRYWPPERDTFQQSVMFLFDMAGGHVALSWLITLTHYKRGCEFFHQGGGATNTHDNWIVGRFILYAIRVVSKESLCVCLRIPRYSICTAETAIWGLLQPSKSKIWSWVLWDSERKLTLLSRVGSKLLDWTVYPTIVARQRLCKHVPAARKKRWRRHFLCGPCCIKEK